MEDKELEKLLKSFDKVKAPSELDNRLLAYLHPKKKKKAPFSLVYVVGSAFLLFVIFRFFNGKNSVSQFLFSDELYAAVSVPGYFETEIEVSYGDRARLIMDGVEVQDTLITEEGILHVEFNTTPGFHYIIIRVEDMNGEEKYTKVVDIYSL